MPELCRNRFGLRRPFCGGRARGSECSQTPSCRGFHTVCRRCRAPSEGVRVRVWPKLSDVLPCPERLKVFPRLQLFSVFAFAIPFSELEMLCESPESGTKHPREASQIPCQIAFASQPGCANKLLHGFALAAKPFFSGAIVGNGRRKGTPTMAPEKGGAEAHHVT